MADLSHLELDSLVGYFLQPGTQEQCRGGLRVGIIAALKNANSRPNVNAPSAHLCSAIFMARLAESSSPDTRTSSWLADYRCHREGFASRA